MCRLARTVHGNSGVRNPSDGVSFAMLAHMLHMHANTAGGDRVTRRFSAPRERVFDAWFDPDKLRVWMFEPPWGGMLRVSIDARVGGTFSFVERRNGVDVATRGEYLEIERPHRIVFTWSTPRHSPVVHRIAVEIASVAGGCELTLTREAHGERSVEQAPPPPSGSWSRMFAALAETLTQ